MVNNGRTERAATTVKRSPTSASGLGESLRWTGSVDILREDGTLIGQATARLRFFTDEHSRRRYDARLYAPISAMTRPLLAGELVMLRSAHGAVAHAVLDPAISEVGPTLIQVAPIRAEECSLRTLAGIADRTKEGEA